MTWVFVSFVHWTPAVQMGPECLLYKALLLFPPRWKSAGLQTGSQGISILDVRILFCPLFRSYKWLPVDVQCMERERFFERHSNILKHSAILRREELFVYYIRQACQKQRFTWANLKSVFQLIKWEKRCFHKMIYKNNRCHNKILFFSTLQMWILSSYCVLIWSTNLNNIYLNH